MHVVYVCLSMYVFAAEKTSVIADECLRYCVCVCVCVCVWMGMHQYMTYVYVCVSVYVCSEDRPAGERKYTWDSVFVCVRACLCMRGCINVVYVCVCVCFQQQRPSWGRRHTWGGLNMYVYVRMCMFMTHDDKCIIHQTYKTHKALQQVADPTRLAEQRPCIPKNVPSEMVKAIDIHRYRVHTET